VNRKRDLAEAAAGAVVLAVAFVLVFVFAGRAVESYYFGYPDGAVWSNLVASLICAVLIWWRVRARLVAHHVQALAESAQHHREAQELAQDQHRQLMAQASKHHGQIMAQADANHQVLVANHQALAAKVADAQVSAGAGVNPAQGLPADQRVVPPAATARRRKDPA
jgi:hypothetical protein